MSAPPDPPPAVTVTAVPDASGIKLEIWARLADAAALGWLPGTRLAVSAAAPGQIGIRAGGAGACLQRQGGALRTRTRRVVPGWRLVRAVYSLCVPAVAAPDGRIVVTLPAAAWAADASARQRRPVAKAAKACLCCGRPVDHPSPTIRLCPDCGARARTAAWEVGA